MQLPLAYRTVLTLFYIEDLPVREVAQILDMPVGTVKTHLHRGSRSDAADLGGTKAMIGERQSKGGGRMARRVLKGEKRWLCRLAARYGWLEDPKPAPGGRPGHRDVGGSDGAHGPTAFRSLGEAAHPALCSLQG